MAKSLLKNFSSDSKVLHAFMISLGDEEIPEWVPKIIEDAFRDLAPFMRDKSQVVYLRDIPFLTIDDKYAAGGCYNRHEAMIALLNWHTQKPELTAVVRHELHHMARWQNVGYGDTLGGAILSEGIATHYENLASGWVSPWSLTKVDTSVIQKALNEWDDKNYNHSAWFYEDTYGKWTGYGLGMMLATELYKDGFNLKDSIFITADQAKGAFKQLVRSLE